MRIGQKTALTVAAASGGGFYVIDGRRLDPGVLTEPLAAFSSLDEALAYVLKQMSARPDLLAEANMQANITAYQKLA